MRSLNNSCSQTEQFQLLMMNTKKKKAPTISPPQIQVTDNMGGMGKSHLVVFSPATQEQHRHQGVFQFHAQKFQPHLQYLQPLEDFSFSDNQTPSA